MVLKLIVRHWLLWVLLFMASLEFFLLLRHKTPYVSDSYFYTHIFYEIKGDSFEEAHEKVIAKVAVAGGLSPTGHIFFRDAERYKYSLSRYRKWPLYPFMAYLINLVTGDEYAAFRVPVFMAYIGCIALVYFLFLRQFERWWAVFGTFLFVNFYPFLDWSTVFLTDTIGAFFWLLQLYLLLKYVEKPSLFLLKIYILFLGVSLLNREQSLLMFVAVGLVFVCTKAFGMPKKVRIRLRTLFKTSLVVSLVYLLLMSMLKQPGLYDSWIYLQSNFGTSGQDYSLPETVAFLVKQVGVLHIVLLEDMVHHRRWVLVVVLGLVGAIQVFLVRRKPLLLDMVMWGSSVAAYMGLLVVPFLAYRYFYPTIIGVIYFSLYALRYLYVRERDPIRTGID